MEIRQKSGAFIEDYMSGSAFVNESTYKTKPNNSVLQNYISLGLIDTQDTLLLDQGYSLNMRFFPSHDFNAVFLQFGL